MCLETTWNCTTVHLFSSQTCCVTSAEDAHVLRVAPLECQRGSPAPPSPPRHRTAGTGASAERCPPSSELSHSTQQFPTAAWKCKGKGIMTPIHHQQNSLGYWSSASTESSCRVGITFTKCRVLQQTAWHSVRCSLNTEQNRCISQSSD